MNDILAASLIDAWRFSFRTPPFLRRSRELHPHTFYSTLYGHDKRDEVFVVMSFADEFTARWKQVIEPTIRDDLKLFANRVDFNRSGESQVHDKCMTFLTGSPIQD